MRLILSVILLATAACGPELAQRFEAVPNSTTGPGVVVVAAREVRAPQLGRGDHTPESVNLTEIAGPAAGLRRPRDLAFNPRRPDELWVVSFDDDSVTVISNASLPTRSTERLKDGYALHFMERPSSIAFGGDTTSIGKPGTFATCHESRNTYDDMAAANDFMGPALWSSDLSVFARANPYGSGAHLDMLHESPNCMGIAHERDNVFWVFGGKAQSGAEPQRPIPAIVRYDFQQDHGIGADNHSDGQVSQYVELQVKDVPGVPSHLAFDTTTRLLYIADTGNARLGKLDTTSGTRGASLQAQEPLGAYDRMDGAVVSDVVPQSSRLLVRPSGIALLDGLIYVSDNATGRIHAFSPEGEQLNWLDTGRVGVLAGIAFGPDGKLYFVDMVANRVLRIDPKDSP